MSSTDAVRTVAVRPPDRARETVLVLRAAAVVAALALLVIGLRREGSAVAAPAYPYQMLYEDQPADVRRVVSELVSGMEELVRVRSDEGAWPDVKTLAEDFVAPFAPVAGAPFDVTWEFVKDGDFVNYLARPVPGLGGPGFLLLIQENVLHPPGYTRNEFDRLLDDGTFVHFGVWMHEEPESIPDFLAAPERAGWRQIITGDIASRGTS